MKAMRQGRPQPAGLGGPAPRLGDPLFARPLAHLIAAGMLCVSAASFAQGGSATPAAAQAADSGHHAHHGAHGAQTSGHAHGHAGASVDQRQIVEFPEPMRTHTLSNMRDHLAALGEIQLALSKQAYDQAAELAERRLGMSSLPLHGAHQVARFMPPGMRAAGTAMHSAASRFALAARNASALGDSSGALSALAELTGTCVACHAGYRFK